MTANETLTKSCHLRINQPVKVAVFSAFFGGWLIYAFAATNITLCTGDALTNVEFNGNMVWLGRWSAEWLSAFSTNFSLPAVAVGISLAALSLAAGFVCSLLKFRSSLWAGLCGLVMVCHPAVGEIMKYTHNTDAYQLAILLAAAAVYLADQQPFRGWFVPAGLLLGIGVGAYQATLSFAVSIMTVAALRHILFGDRDDRELALTALRFAVTFLIALTVYLLGTWAGTHITGISLTDYQSVSHMGQFSLKEFLHNFIGCYRDFKKDITYISCRDGWFVSGYPNYLLTACAMGMCVVAYLRSKAKSPLRTAVMLILLALLPMLLCSIRLTNPGSVEQRMTYSTVGIFLLALVCGEQISHCSFDSAFWRVCVQKLAPLAALICTCVALLGWSVGINLDFFRGKLTYDRMSHVCSHFAQMAEQVEGYEADMPIYIIGSSDCPEISALGFREPKYYYAFMHFYTGLPMPYGIANEVNAAAKEIADTEAFAAMPAYPKEGCCCLIDQCVIIKLGDAT